MPGGSENGGQWTSGGGGGGIGEPGVLLGADGAPILNFFGAVVQFPSLFSPEFFIDEGMSTADEVSNLLHIGDDSFAAPIKQFEKLFNFRQNGKWDIQRLEAGKFDEKYRDYSTIAIGLYSEAAGIPESLNLEIQNTYASLFSKFGKNDPMDKVYTSLPARNVRNTRIGHAMAKEILKQRGRGFKQ